MTLDLASATIIIITVSTARGWRMDQRAIRSIAEYLRRFAMRMPGRWRMPAGD